MSSNPSTRLQFSDKLDATEPGLTPRGRPVGSSAALHLTPEQRQELSSQRMNHGFLLVPDIMRLFNRGDRWVKDQINSGRLQAKQLGHEYIATWDAVLQFIESLPDVSNRTPLG
jgi:hypothetical protein